MTRDGNDKRSGRSKRSHGARRDSSIERSRQSGSVNRPRRRSQRQPLGSEQTSRSRSKNASTAQAKGTTQVKAALRQRAWIVPCSVAGVVVLVTLGIIVWSLMRPDHSNTATTVTGSKTEAKPEEASSAVDDVAIANSDDDESGVSIAENDRKQPKKQMPSWNADILERNRTFELPKRGLGASADSQELAKIHLPETAPIELKLIAPRSGKDNKSGLYLNASDGETALLRSWTVTRKSTDTFGSERTTPIGQFQLANDSLTFAWDENVPDWADPQTLMYCLLEITVGDATETCVLGKPDRVEDIRISFNERNYEPELKVNTNAVDEPRNLFVDLVCTNAKGDVDVASHQKNQNQKASTALTLFQPLIGWQIGQRKVFTIERSLEQQRAMNQQRSSNQGGYGEHLHSRGEHDVASGAHGQSSNDGSSQDGSSPPRGNTKNAPKIEVEIELAYDENKGLYLKWRTYTFMQHIVYPTDWFAAMERQVTIRQASIANLEHLYQIMREFRVTELARTGDAIILKDVNPDNPEVPQLDAKVWHSSLIVTKDHIDDSVAAISRSLRTQAADNAVKTKGKSTTSRAVPLSNGQDLSNQITALQQLNDQLQSELVRLAGMPTQLSQIQQERQSVREWLVDLTASYRIRYTVYRQLQGRKVRLTQSELAVNAAGQLHRSPANHLKLHE